MKITFSIILFILSTFLAGMICIQDLNPVISLLIIGVSVLGYLYSWKFYKLFLKELDESISVWDSYTNEKE